MHALHIVVEILVRTGPGKRHDRRAGLEGRRKIRFISQEEQKVHPKRFRCCCTNGRDPLTYFRGALAGHTEDPQSSSVRDSRYQRHRGACCHSTQDNGMGNTQKVTHRCMNHHVSPHGSVHHPDCRALLFA